jgi:tetratricopeptide (TPR) repeat protein
MRNDVRFIGIFGFSLSLLVGQSDQQSFRNALDDIKRRDFAAAEAQIKQGLQEVPTSPLGFDLLGITYDGEGRSNEAEEAFRRAVALDPHFIPARNDLGLFLCRRGRLSGAVGEFQSVLAQDGLNFTANYSLGIIAKDSKRYLDALKYLRLAHSLDPSDPSTLIVLVSAYLGASKAQEADLTASQLLALQPSNPAICFSLGALFFEWKNYQKAEQYFRKARSLNSQSYEVLYNLSLADVHLKKYADAEDACLKALAIRPDSVDALYELAAAYAEDHKSDESIQVLVRARQLAPHRPDILLLLARECIQEGLWDDAVDLLVECVGLDPSKMEPRLLLAEAYTRAHMYDKALTEYKEISKLDPYNPESLVAVGRTLRYLGHYDEAKVTLNKALTADSHKLEAAYYLGCIAEDQNDLNSAKKWFEQVLRGSPANAGSLFELGNLYTTERDQEHALEYYERAAKASPTYAPTYYRMSVIYRRLKDADRANATFAMFKKYEQSQDDNQQYHPHGVLTFLAQTQDLPENERLARYKQELLHVAEIQQNDLNVSLMLAQVSFRLGERTAALERIDQIAKLAPNDSNVRIRIATLLRMFQLYAQATDQLQAFLKQNDTADDVRIALAKLYYEVGRTDDAVQLLMEKVNRSGQPAAFYYLLGRLLIEQGKLSEAAQEFQRAAALNPDCAECSAYLGICAAELGHDKEATRWLAAAKSKGPNNPTIIYAEGIVLLIRGNSNEAQNTFQRAADLSYDWEPPWLALADAPRNSPSHQIKVLDQTASLFPRSPWPHFLKAKILNSDVELENTLRLATADPRIYQQILRLCLERGKCQQVQEVRRRLVELGVNTESGAAICTGGSGVAGSSNPDANLVLLIEMLGDSAREM